MASIRSVMRQLTGIVTANEAKFLDRVGLQGERIMKGEAPVKQGTLRRSITSRREGRRVRIGTNIAYAQAVHDGTRPHVIKAKNAKALYWKGAKHPVRSVNHPGTKPNKFVDRTAEALKPVIEREGNAIFGDAFRGVG